PDSTRTGVLRAGARDGSPFASEQPAQLARRTEQMNADRGFVQAGDRADFLRRAVAVLAQHEHRPLTSIEPIDGCRDAGATLTGQKLVLRIDWWLRCGQSRFGRARYFTVHEPPIAAGAGLAPIQTPIDENSCEPDLERPRLAIGPDVREHLDERILD